MKPETIEETINQINDTENQLRSIRAQLKKFGNDLMSKSQGETMQSEAKQPEGTMNGFSDVNGDRHYFRTQIEEIEFYKQRADDFEKGYGDLLRRLNDSERAYFDLRSQYAKETTVLEEKNSELHHKVKSYQDNEMNLETAAGNYKIQLDAAKRIMSDNVREYEEVAAKNAILVNKITDLTTKNNTLREIKDHFKKKSGDLRTQLFKADALIDGVANMNIDLMMDVDAVRQGARRYVEQRTSKPEKEETWLEEALRATIDRIQKDTDSMKKASGDGCDCPACQLEKMISEGLKSGKYRKQGAIIFGTSGAMQGSLLESLDKLFGHKGPEKPIQEQ